MNEQKLPMNKIFMFGAAVFAMHFGASCMLWPVTWGQQSGSSVLSAMVGIVLTAILLPFAAYVAIVRGEGSFYKLAERINKKFGFIFGSLTVLVLGPLFVIPRMSAAAWDAFVKVFDLNPDAMVPVVLFQIVYYLVAYWFLCQQGEILNKLGKYLTPILVVTVIAVVYKSLTNPLSEWMPKLYPESGFTYGFIGGYQTMDLPAALIYGAIIINNLKEENVKGKGLLRGLLIVGAVGFFMLACSHLSQMLVGASTGYVYRDVSYARLYATVILDLWGTVGGTLFNIALLFAALTSAVGLGSGTAEFFEEASAGKWPYKKNAIITLAVSALMACVGLNSIIVITAPILSLIYPPCIALVMGYIIMGNRNIPTIGGATIAAFGWGLIDCVIGYMGLAQMDTSGIMSIYSYMPGADAGIAWVIPTLIGAAIGYFFFKDSEPKHNETVLIEE